MDRKNMLDVIFESRIDEMALVNEEEYHKMLKDVKSEINYDSYTKFVRSLPLSEADKDKLIDMADEIESVTNYAFGVVNEKYYKAGLSDAVNFIFDCFEQKKLGEK